MTSTSNVPDLHVRVAALHLQNPLMAASGTCGYGEELHAFTDLNHLGAVVVKGLSLQPAAGNAGPRLIETACGMLNSVGLHNIGIEAFIKLKLPQLRQFRTQIVDFINSELTPLLEDGKWIDDCVGKGPRQIQ